MDVASALFAVAYSFLSLFAFSVGGAGAWHGDLIAVPPPPPPLWALRISLLPLLCKAASHTAPWKRRMLPLSEHLRACGRACDSQRTPCDVQRRSSCVCVCGWVGGRPRAIGCAHRAEVPKRAILCWLNRRRVAGFALLAVVVFPQKGMAGVVDVWRA